MRSEHSDDVIDTIVPSFTGKDSVLSSSRVGDSSTQWIQLLNAFDQPDLPGWPMIIPQKIQMQKCEKCSLEFCATVNYRRHVRMHRRSLNVDKDSHKIRGMLADFWDKLSLEKAKEVASFNDVTLKEVSGTSVTKAWLASTRKPGAWTLPQDYVKSGTILLDIINAKPSRLPISSQDLFYILDNASEKTFLCAGTAESLQNYVFDGNVSKTTHELRNMVACISFLFELKLVKAWLADKDAEALKCQKLLMEEEEAARQRRAALSKKKKERKLRQKDQREREQSLVIENPLVDVIVNSLERSSLVDTSSQSTPGSSSDAPNTSPADAISLDKPVQSLQNEKDIDNNHGEGQIVYSGSAPNVESPVEEYSTVHKRLRVSKSQRNRRNGFHEGQHQNPQLVQQVEPSSHKVWTKKSRTEHDEVQPDENKCELIIGSISVSLPVKSHIVGKKDVGLRNKQNRSDDIKQIPNSENVQATRNRRRWRALNNVSETQAHLPIVQSVNRDSKNKEIVEKLDAAACNGIDGSCQQSAKNDSLNDKKAREFLSSISDVTVLKAGVADLDLPSVSAKALLAERWKDAVSADHVKLVLSSGSESSGGGTHVNKS